MDAFTTMADQLARKPESASPSDENGSKTGRMRRELRENGPATARRLANVAQLPSSGLVSALLKHDVHVGRMTYADGNYRWNRDFIEAQAPCDGRTRVRDVLDWHEVADGDFPDADLTVFVRMRNNEEPVWLGYWDGEAWRDVDGLIIDVVRWVDMPKGGDA